MSEIIDESAKVESLDREFNVSVEVKLAYLGGDRYGLNFDDELITSFKKGDPMEKTVASIFDLKVEDIAGEEQLSSAWRGQIHIKQKQDTPIFTLSVKGKPINVFTASSPTAEYLDQKLNINLTNSVAEQWKKYELNEKRESSKEERDQKSYLGDHRKDYMRNYMREYKAKKRAEKLAIESGLVEEAPVSVNSEEIRKAIAGAFRLLKPFMDFGAKDVLIGLYNLDQSLNVVMKIEGVTPSDLRAIHEFKKSAKKGWVGAKGKPTLPAVKKWIKDNKPDQYYAKWEQDSSFYKDDSVEIYYSEAGSHQKPNSEATIEKELPDIVTNKKEELLWEGTKKEVSELKKKPADRFSTIDWDLVTTLFKKAKVKYDGCALPREYTTAKVGLVEALARAILGESKEKNAMDALFQEGTSKPSSFNHIPVVKDSLVAPFMDQILKLSRQTVANGDTPLANDAPSGTEQYYIVRIMNKGTNKISAVFIADTQGYEYGRYWVRLSPAMAAKVNQVPATAGEGSDWQEEKSCTRKQLLDGVSSMSGVVIGDRIYIPVGNKLFIGLQRNSRLTLWTYQGVYRTDEFGNYKLSSHKSLMIFKQTADTLATLRNIHTEAMKIKDSQEKVAFVEKAIDEAREKRYNQITAGSNNILYSKRNEDDTLEARIVKVSDGYSVTLRDLEANKTLPAANIYPTLDQAKKEADKMVNSSLAFKAGDIVRIKPEWRDPRGGDELYIIVEWNGDRGLIEPHGWWKQKIVPQNLVREKMIEKAEKVTARRDIKAGLYAKGKNHYLFLMQDDEHSWSGVEMDGTGKVFNEYANEEILDNSTFQYIPDINSADLPRPVKVKINELYQSWSY